jgi:hypothetical protein
MDDDAAGMRRSGFRSFQAPADDRSYEMLIRPEPDAAAVHG